MITFTALRDTYFMIFHMLNIKINAPELVLSSTTDAAFATLTAFTFTYNNVNHQATVDLRTYSRQFKAGNSYSFTATFSVTPPDDDLWYLQNQI